jgi:acetyl-CoA/propionyl-CoA carboxylase biotin carboxyl carrier protein
VASVPGTLEPIVSVDDIVAFGDEHGWPVAIKAAYGGGGKGMKICREPEGAAAAFESATREATAYFGRPEAYLERYLTRPRHIEMQIFCDTHGNAVWLGERDCSTQRRHQKLIEESPASGLPDATREAMGAAAVSVAKACGYVNAGTVEMLYQDEEFWFLEMNTRLQVEHCVTEEVTGFDLVAEQIRVASGLPLSFTQESISLNGHAIECRINAEDPAKGFLPSPGTITRLRIPSGPGVRWDGGYDEGDTVSQFYDNLIGKLVVLAHDREAATERAQRALRELVVEGVRTTTPAHLALLSDPAWANGTHSTKWVEDEFDTTTFAGTTQPVAVTTADETDTTPTALVERTVPVEVNGKRFSVRLWLPDAPVNAGGGAARRTPRPRPAAAGSAGGAGDGVISAPMQGTIVKVLIAEGDEVEAGQALLVLEAMKMENHINALAGGTVKEIRVEAGDTVGPGDVLLVLG